MSRIDQALQRTAGADSSASVEPATPAANPVVKPVNDDRQQLFSPAWSDGTGPAGAGGAGGAGGVDDIADAPVGGAAVESHPVAGMDGDAVVMLADAPAPPGRAANAPVGLVGFSSQWRERLASGTTGDAALVEQFRRLAATLHHAQQNNGLRSVMITSAQPGDGKTLTAVNLAIVLSESYRYNVLLIDADLRRPSIPAVLDLAQGSGLSEVLRANQDQKLALVPLTPRLTLLPAGQPTSNSIEALTSPRMKRILDEALHRYDWIILDAPPVGPAADAHLLTQMVGGVLFVVRAGKTPSPAVEAAIKGIGRDQILGIVLNGVSEVARHDYYYYAPDAGPKPA